MIELAMGTRFYYKGKLFEVVDPQSGCCRECAVGYGFCTMLECNSYLRKDGKDVCFKQVEEIEDVNNV